MKKGNPIKIEQLEVGKNYSIAFGGVAYFIVLKKTESAVIVEYPKRNDKYRVQTFTFLDHQDKEINGVQYQHRYQERLAVK